jgi:hypothetical protein
MQISGKGHNAILEIINPLQHMMIVTDSVHGRVPENRDSRAIHIFGSVKRKPLRVESHRIESATVIIDLHSSPARIQRDLNVIQLAFFLS